MKWLQIKKNTHHITQVYKCTVPNITLINSLVLILLIYFGKTTMPNATQTAAKAKPGQPKQVAKNNNKKDAAGSKRFHAKGKQG